MAKIVYLNNWYKETAIPFFAFPYNSLFGADVALDVKNFLMYADKKAVFEGDITPECLNVFSDEIADQISYALACVDYNSVELETADGELNVCLVTKDIPESVYNLLDINGKIDIFCRRVSDRMEKYREDLTEATENTIDEIMFWIFD